MHEFTCLGLPAAWLNAWLAGVGATILDHRIRLHWTAQDTPVAVLSSDDIDPVEALAASWPDLTFLEDLPIAKGWRGASELKRKVSVDEFAARAKAARGHPQVWTLSSTMTDLSVEKNGEVAHAPFDPAGPGTIKWLHHRVLQIHKELICPMGEERLRDSLAGRGKRIQNNGLGFDITRLGSLADASGPWIEPVVELLAFFGLAMLPMRAGEVDRVLGRTDDKPDERQRGWRKVTEGSDKRRFFWPAWQQALDAAGVDALLDVWNPNPRYKSTCWASVGIHAAWQSVWYQRRGQADNTRAFGAQRL